MVEFAPTDWLRSGVGDACVIRAYRAFVAPGTNPSVFDVGLVRAVLYKGSLNYFDAGTITVVQNEDASFDLELKTGGPRTTPVQWHLLLLSPFRWNDGDSEAVAWSRTDEATGLLQAMNGMSAAYAHVCDNRVKLDGTKTTTYASSVCNPQTLRQPTWYPAVLRTIEGIASAIEALPPAKRGPIQLSLRWFTESFRATGVDAFLKRWIALETLMMPDSTDIRPLMKLLGDAYGEESEGFGIGRIYGRRCRVVHEGEKQPVPSLLLDYMDAVFTDCLFATVGANLPRRIEEMFTMHGTTLSNLLAQL